MYYEMQYTEDFTTSMRFCVKDGTGEAITKEENIVIEEKWSVISRSGTWFYSWLIHILEISNHINGFALLEKKEIRIKNELLRWEFVGKKSSHFILKGKKKNKSMNVAIAEFICMIAKPDEKQR